MATKDPWVTGAAFGRWYDPAVEGKIAYYSVEPGGVIRYGTGIAPTMVIDNTEAEKQLAKDIEEKGLTLVAAEEEGYESIGEYQLTITRDVHRNRTTLMITDSVDAILFSAVIPDSAAHTFIMPVSLGHKDFIILKKKE